MARLPQRRTSSLRASDAHVEAFKALAHLTRLQAFFLLVKAGGELTVGEIQQELDVPAPTMSHHLNVLRQAGLVERRKEERFVYYSVDVRMVSDLQRLLSACC